MEEERVEERGSLYMCVCWLWVGGARHIAASDCPFSLNTISPKRDISAGFRVFWEKLREVRRRKGSHDFGCTGFF
jgi:hypothetical protein